MDFLLLKLRTTAQSRQRQPLPPPVCPVPTFVRNSADSPDAAAGIFSCVDAAEMQERSMRMSLASATAEESFRRRA
eukprot:1922284-Amphidinium_carterae.1